MLVYHKVDSKIELGLTRVTPYQFERQIEFLHSKGYRFVTLSDLFSKHRDDPKCIAITFDDGYSAIRKYALPVLKKYKGVATIFLITSFIGKMNTWDANLGWLHFRHLNESEVLELIDEGWEVGSHGIKHRCLLGMNDEELESEIGTSKMILESQFGVDVSYFSPPFGKINTFVVEHCIRAGYNGICDFYPFSYYKNSPRNSYIITRFSIYLTDNLKSLDRKLSNGFRLWIEILKQNAIHFCSNATILVRSLR